MRSLIAAAAASAVALCGASTSGASPGGVENVLFFVVDDLRPPAPGTHTPRIDELRSRGTTFTRAYTQVAICGPSRASFLTSLRPNQNHVWTIGPNFRDTMANNTDLPGKDVVTLPQLFKNNGFNVTGSGKVCACILARGGGQVGWRDTIAHIGESTGGQTLDRDARRVNDALVPVCC